MSSSDIPHSPHETFVIGITGGSGSGKTSFIKELRDQFTESELCIMSQDDYYKERDKQIVDENRIRNFDLPESILTDEMIRDIGFLLKGNPVTRQEYVFNNEKAVSKTIIFKPARVLIVEGLFVFHHEELMALFDLKLFIEAKDNLKVIRRIKRDKLERNYPLEDVLYRYENHVLPAFEKYIHPYKSNADLVINNNSVRFDMAIKVIAGFIRSLL